MKLWVDDIRPTPEECEYVWVRSVNEAKKEIEKYESFSHIEYLVFHLGKIELIDIDHDAGEYASDGGDYIKLLDWLEETDRNYPIHIHSMNPVGVENMRQIIQKNGWKEI